LKTNAAINSTKCAAHKLQSSKQEMHPEDGQILRPNHVITIINK